MNQDWTPVILKGRGTTDKQRKVAAERSGATTTIKKGSVGNSHARKVNQQDDVGEIKRVPKVVGQRIQQGRASKRLTQKDLANQLNVQTNIVAAYENGSAQPDNRLLQRMERVLGVKLTGKM